MTPLYKFKKVHNGGTDFQPWRGRMSNEPIKSLGQQNDLKLHHIGFVVLSIQESAESFELSVGATWGGSMVLIRRRGSG